MQQQGLVVIGIQASVETSTGALALGEMRRLPVPEAIQLKQLNQVTYGDWQEQQLQDPTPRRRR